MYFISYFTLFHYNNNNITHTHTHTPPPPPHPPQPTTTTIIITTTALARTLSRPPNGYIPFQLVPESRRWSISRPHGAYFSDDAVVTIDGEVSVIEHKEDDSRMPTIVFEGM